MNWAYELLGLSPGADEGSVKRAYAKLLRTTRPDEDPTAFQRLHNAYKLVLAQASQRLVVGLPPAAATKPIAASTDQQSATTPTHSPLSVIQAPAMTPAMLGGTSRAAINLDAITNRVLTFVDQAQAASELVPWLGEQPELWSVQVKSLVGQRVLSQLFSEPRPMAGAYLDSLLRFFDLDHVLSGVNPFAIQQLRRRQIMLWELSEENRTELAVRTRLFFDGTQRPDSLRAQQLLSELRSPLTLQTVVRTALKHLVASQLAQFTRDFCDNRLEELPPALNQKTVRFWQLATDKTRMSWPRYLVGLSRALAAAIGAALALTVIVVIGVLVGGSFTEGERIALAIAGGLILSALAIWSLFAGWSWLRLWQASREIPSERPPWLRRYFVPSACFVTLLMHYAAGLESIAIIASIAIFSLSIRRFNRHYPGKPPKKTQQRNSYLGLLYFAALAISRGVADASKAPFALIIAIAAIALWSIDFWRHRSVFKRASAYPQ